MTEIETPDRVGYYDAKSYDPKASIGGLLSRVKMKLFDALEAELEPLGITAAQYVILVNLASGVDSASGLCRSVSYDPGAMTRMIDRLEKKRLVKRVPCAEDRRIVRLALTDEGRAVYPQLVEKAAGVLNDRLRGFEPEEVKQLERLLERMVTND
ncbi:MAG TPA: MarR family transcriptional regulator [Casimicrobiaceae bacterium]|nr:MarR family transcriptional regulator [Casimicrobiaceae bacterium]